MHIILQMPQWVNDLITQCQEDFSSEEKRMRFVIKLASMNIEEKTGGPFGAAVFNTKTNQLVAPGVNLVISANCSVAHAEIMSIMLAQKSFNSYNLRRNQLNLQLVTSTEPCSMCLGALIWSGIKNIVCGARDEDARAIGFDEGAKPADWMTELSNRGIFVRRDVCRTEACHVLQHYKYGGGVIYNG